MTSEQPTSELTTRDVFAGVRDEFAAVRAEIAALRGDIAVTFRWMIGINITLWLSVMGAILLK